MILDLGPSIHLLLPDDLLGNFYFFRSRDVSPEILRLSLLVNQEKYEDFELRHGKRGNLDGCGSDTEKLCSFLLFLFSQCSLHKRVEKLYWDLFTYIKYKYILIIHYFCLDQFGCLFGCGDNEEELELGAGADADISGRIVVCAKKKQRLVCKKTSSFNFFVIPF